MDFKLMMTTFIMIFLAELGDKTQVATFCLSADCESSRLSVLLGSAAALVISALIATVLGNVVTRFIPQSYFKLIAGAVFIIFGVFTSYAAIRSIFFS